MVANADLASFPEAEIKEEIAGRATNSGQAPAPFGMTILLFSEIWWS
jgi:hypothetical protein